MHVNVLQDIRALQHEVLQFRLRLKDLEDVQVQNISAIARRIEKEVRSLENASEDDHIRSSTNAPDLVRMWRLARSLPALYAFNTTFQSFSRKKSDSLIVDIVYRKGHAWMIRNSLKYRALISEITNLPIRGDPAASSRGLQSMDIDSGHDTVPSFVKEESFISLGSTTTQEDDEDLFCDTNISQLKIIELARKLLELAGNNLKIGAAPHSTIYFPRILEECRNEEDLDNVRKVFEFLQRMEISCITEIGPPLPFENNVGLLMKDDFGNEELQLSPHEAVHLDLTTLFVMSSDISNVNLSELQESHGSLAFQMKEEAAVPCLRDRVFPIIRGQRPLICTPIAHHRFLEIVAELGSVYEKQRAALMFVDQNAELSCQQLSSISIHSWPPDLRLPIIVRKFEVNTYEPSVPFDIDFKTAIAQDCFENCWNGRILTLSANQQAVRTFREALFRWPDYLRPKPTVYLHAARSLTLYDRAVLKGRQNDDDDDDLEE